MKTGIGLALCAVAFAGCQRNHDPDRFSPITASAIDSMLEVAVNPLSLPADGVSRSVVSARIDPASRVRTLSFESTLGTLFAGGKQGTAATGPVTVDADSSGIATVELQSPGQVGTGRVTVSIQPPGTNVPKIVRSVDVPFTNVVLDNLMQVSTSEASLPADGFSRATITATLRFGGDLRRPVTFTTTRGTLIKFGATGGSTTETVTADASGVARIQLQADSTVGTAQVTADVSGYNRGLFVQFVPVSPTSIIRLAQSRDSAPADGATRTQFIAAVSPNIPEASRTVVFTTTDGSFTSDTDAGNLKRATVEVDAGNTAVVELRSPLTAANASIAATIANVTTRSTVNFTRALPTTILVSLSKSSATRAGSDSVDITVKLMRDVGQVANNTVVTYEARDAAGKPIGFFNNVTLATTTNVDPAVFEPLTSTATFDPDDTAAAGAATITIKAGTLQKTVSVLLN